MENNLSASKKDNFFGFLAGALIGLLFLPVLRAAKPDLYESLKFAIVPFFFIATPLGLAIAHIIGRKISLIWQLAKFVVIGVLNTLVDLGILSLLVFIFRDNFQIDATSAVLSGLGIITFYSLFKAASFVIANVNSYYWNKYWTFENHTSEKTGKEFFQFLTVSLIGFAINVTIASIVFGSVTPLAGFNPDQWGLIGAGIGSIAGLGWNFVGYKFIVFKKQ